jgi:hypothetical protein
MEIGVDILGGSSNSFRGAVSDTIARLPPQVAAELAEGGVRVVAGRRLTEAWPALEDQHPPGFPDDATYDNVRGVADLSKPPTAYVAETYRPLGSTDFRAVANVPGVLRHELGHAYDALGETLRSSAIDLQEVYSAGVARVRERDRPYLVYFLQEDGAGVQELFAEVFAMFAGGGAAPYAAEAIRRTFPEFLARTRTLMGLP